MLRAISRIVRPATGLLVFINLISIPGSPAAAAGVLEPKRILILYSYDKEEGIYAPLDQTLRSSLKAHLPGRVELYTEYLDLVRFPVSKHTQALVQLLRLKFEGKKPDVIIPVSYFALKFLFEGGKDLFPGVPIVALFNQRRSESVAAAAKQSPSRQDLTGVEGRDDPAASLDLALKLQPDTERVAVVVGSSPNEKFWMQQLQSDFAPYSAKVTVTYLTGQTMPELLKQLAALPPHTVIFYSFFFEDSRGQSYLPEEALDLITSSTNAPVYGMYNTYLDHGIVGGRVPDAGKIGADLARLVLRVLNGEKASSIPPIVDSSLYNVVEWRQLRRWGISEERIPPGTLVLHREPSLWERYHSYILAALLLFVLEGALIFGLLIERQRRRRAEKRLLRQKALADAVIETLPGVLLLQDKELKKNIRWNKNAVRVGRFDPASTAPLANVAEACKAKAREAVRRALEQGKAVVELEILAGEGATIPYYFNFTRMDIGSVTYIIAVGIDVTELKHTQEELKISDERFSSAFEHAAIGIVLVAPDGRYLKVNEALCRMLGYTADELQGKSYREITHPDDVGKDEENVRRVLAGERTSYQRREKRYIHRSGQVVWASLATSLVRDNNGKPLYFVSQIQDITDRKKVEDSIRTIVEGVRAGTSSEFFKSLVLQVSKATGAEHVFIGELVAGDEAMIRSLGNCVNRAIVENVTFKLSGGPAEEVVRNGTVTSYRSKVASHFPDVAALRDLGAQAYVGVPLVDSHDHVIGIMAAIFSSPLDDPGFVESVLQVFSKWTAAELERGRAEERFARAFQNNPAACAIASLQTGQFIEANDSFLRMLEYERDEVIGTTVTDLRHWENSERRAEVIRKIRETGRVREEEVKFKTKTGKIIEARFSGEVIQLQNEPCLLGLARDVTEQNVLEEKLRQSQKMEAVGMLAGGVAHDFNNLLGVIIGYSEMLTTSAVPNSPTLKKIDAIKQAAQRAAMLTTQLLAYSRKQAIQPRVSNLNSIVSETEKMLRRLIGENIQLLVIQEQKLDYVNIDPGQIVQVLMNLAVNARDAMSKKGKLTLETANVVIGESGRDTIAPGRYVRLSVGDTGTGMDEATKAKIFEPFFTTKEPGQGTGLGLATVQGIVMQSGGSIRVESELGLGTKFEIYFPSVQGGVATQETNVSAPEAASVAATILLVEDEVAMRMVIDESLRADGYQVLAAGNGLDALRIAEQHAGPIDLLITDVIMPAMSGPEVAHALATSRPSTPVLYISGYTADKLSYYPELEPDVALLQKPFKLNVLTQKVRDIIGTVETASPPE